MSNAEFQARLQRIAASPAQSQPEAIGGSSKTVPPKGRKISYGHLGLAAILMAFGSQVLKAANENYEAIRDGFGIGAAVGMGFAGIACLLIGIGMILRVVRIRGASAAEKGQDTHPERTPSMARRVGSSLLGLLIGMAASLSLFLGTAVDGVKGEYVQHTGFLDGIWVAVSLFILSLMIGLAGLVLRGFSLGRVPVYFVFGAILTFSAVWLFRIDVSKWLVIWAQGDSEKAIFLFILFRLN